MNNSTKITAGRKTGRTAHKTAARIFAKKVLLLALVLALVLGLCACGGGGSTPANNSGGSGSNSGSQNSSESQNGSGNNSPAGNDQNNAQDYYFQKGDVKITMYVPSAPIVEALGQYRSSYEAPSCAFDGMDVIYSYPGFDLMTYVKNGEGIISGVVLRDDTVETIEGISIGSDKAAVEKAYGKFDDGANSLKIIKGSCELLIILTDGAVSSIQYTPNEAK